MSEPYESGLVDASKRGREFCAEFCKRDCYAWNEAREVGAPFDAAACSAKPPVILPANRLALRVYQAAFWQFSSSGFGDATFPGTYAQTMLEDLGVIGPARVEAMDKIRIIDEQRRITDRADDGESIRGRRKKKPAAE